MNRLEQDIPRPAGIALPPAFDAEAYAAGLCRPETALLAEVTAYTREQFTDGAHMLSGHYQGQVMAMLAKLIQPKLIIELGTFTGYSALCLADGLAPDGQLYTIDRDARLADAVTSFLARHPAAGRLHYVQATATDVLSNPPWVGQLIDLAFVDADKRSYPIYLEALLPQMRSGGLLIFDNMLWKGRVWQTPPPDRIAAVLGDFNTALSKDARVDIVLLPIRDGLLLVQKC